MIKTFRHKGVERFFQSGNKAGINANHARRLRLILGRLDASQKPSDMGLPGLGLHPLQGRYEGFWSVEVSGNWRVIFRFESKDAIDVDYLDYH